MMKIMHVIDSLDIGGAQRLLTLLLPEMAKEHDIKVLVMKSVENDFKKCLEQNGIDVLSMDVRHYKSPLNLIRMRKHLQGYDVVHAHLFPAFYFAAIASVGLNVHLVMTEHSTSNRRRGKWWLRLVERMIYGRYDYIVSISEQAQCSLMSWLGASCHDRRFVVVHNGIDTSIFPTREKVNSERLHLIMISRFAPSKDQATVIRAMKYIDGKADLCFVGDGPELEGCKELARNLGVEQRIKFLGRRDDVEELIGLFDIGVQSSHWEGFGLTAVELMAAGIPVIASAVDGLKQVVEGAGLLFSQGDAEELARLVNRLIADEGYYEETGRKCLQRARRYDIKNTIESYMDIYNNC